MPLPTGLRLAALRLGVAAVALAAAFAGGWWQGSQAVRTEVALAQAQADRAAAERYRAAVADGQARVAEVLVDLAAVQATAGTLQERLNRYDQDQTPLALVRPARCPGSAAVRTVGRTVAPAAAAAPDGAGLADAGVRLTLGAVGLWNSALAGRELPAGACRADAASGGACAADAGLDLIDAWRNHVANAEACAKDRARYRALIEHLKARAP